MYFRDPVGAGSPEDGSTTVRVRAWIFDFGRATAETALERARRIVGRRVC
jgi:hypothetical protein